MGFAEADVAILAALVRHHLLLPDTATRRDIDDPATVDRVAATIGHDAAVLQLLHALAQADGAATSASAWSPWKAHLVAALVARVQAKLGTASAGRPAAGAAPERAAGHRAGVRGRLRRARSAVGVEDVADGQQLTIGAPDRPGLLSTLAGVLALNQLDVRAAKMSIEDGYATGVFAVRPRFGRAPVPEILADGVRAALEGTLPLAERLRQREADYRQDGVPDGAAADLLAQRRGQRRRHRDRRGARHRPGRAAVPADRGAGGRGPRRHVGADRDPRRRTPSTASTSATRPGTPVDEAQRRRVDDRAGRGHAGRVAARRPSPRVDTPG